MSGHQPPARPTAERTNRILGVPFRTGSLTPGSEDDARAYRDAGLPDRLRAAGLSAVDDGDLAVPSYLPHHRVPPIRSWPGPRIVWDILADRLAPLLRQPGQVPLLIGCDCSIVVGSALALRQAGADDVHVLYLDGDYDDAPPDPEQSKSAAMLAVWLLTHPSPFVAGPPLDPPGVTVIGASMPSQSDAASPDSLTLAALRQIGMGEAARRVLRSIPPAASVVVHLDVDLLRSTEMPAAYFPHEDGLNWPEARELLGGLLTDPRVRIVEIAEYASLRDREAASVTGLIGLLAETLVPQATKPASR
jgi:arginase